MLTDHGPEKRSTTFLSCDSSYEDADCVVFGAPFDGTVSFRPGTRFGPAQMRIESNGIETYSPYLDQDLLDCSVVDIGDLDLPIGNTTRTLDLIREQTALIVGDGKIPFMIGGEHLVSLPAVEAVLKTYPDLCIVHLDAHADLREEFLGETLSHATVMRRIHDQVGDGRIFQFGIRSGSREEFEFAYAGHVRMTTFSTDGLMDLHDMIGDRPVYLTIDLDVLDPSVFPGTGTPEPGGLTFTQLLAAVHALKPLRLVAADLVELSPHYDSSGISTVAALKVMREILLLLSDAKLSDLPDEAQ
jgi:agmatinase